MAIPGPGVAISMNTIATEFGGTVPHSLSEYYRGGGLVPDAPQNAAIPTSGAIPMGSFYGAVNRVAIPLTLAANTFNYDIFTNRGPTYAAGVSDITVTVNPGVTVGSTSTGAFAMLVPSGFNPGDTVTIVNNGVIQGMGGGGGSGGSIVPGGSVVSTPGNPGAGGGSAISVSRPTVITNNGTLAGGGGGGGGGAGRYVGTTKIPAQRRGGGGGGGGAGFNGGAGGAGGIGPTAPGTPGNPGTSPAGGAGGPGTASNPGGAGGGRGAAGSAGTPVTLPTVQPGGAGGAAGNYIVGNPFVTYPATGTRQGGVA